MTINENGASFEEFFTDRVRERGFDLKKLSEASGIAVKHLEALASGNFKNLPPEPYFRGYMKKLGEILNFDDSYWWQKLIIGGFVKSSGREDAMPKNRFIKNISRKTFGVVVMVIVIVVYAAIQLPRAMGKPEITITFPPENLVTASFREFTIAGSVKNASELYINGEILRLEDDGAWTKNIILQSGLNSFEITAKKFLGGETKLVRQVIYNQPNSTTATTGSFTTFPN